MIRKQEVLYVLIVVLLIALSRPSLATGSIASFDDIPPNANSRLLPQSSANWTYVPRTDYGVDNLDQWISTNGDSFYHYQNGYNSAHMGFGDFGFLEIDNKTAIKGNSLKYTIVGGYDETHMPPNYGGMNASNKAEYLTYNKPYTNAVIGSPYLYVIAGTFRPNAGEWVEPFTAAANANRLTFYVKPPAGATALGGDHPYPAWSIGPYSNTQTSGHYYHSFIGMNGWEKLQLDGRPDWTNSGYTPERNMPDYISNIQGFYISYDDRMFMTPHSWWFDEMQFERDDYAPQNEETINNIAVGYEPSSNTWQIGFADKYGTNSGGAFSSYELRYAFSPITNENWNSATPAHILAYPEWNIEDRADGRFQRVHDYSYRTVWAKFALASADDVTFQSSKHIYFAIKDISQNPSDLRRINPSLTGAMAGKGRDYVANPSLYYDYSVDVKNLPYIKRIDYVLPGAAETTPPVVPPVTPPVGDTTPPSAPAGLTVTPVSPAQVNLAWIASTDDVGVAGYRVVRDGSAIATVAATTYQDTAVAPATSYSYAVTAFDAAGNGAASAPVSILTPQALAMSDVDASKVSSSGATITWVTNAPSTSQVVYGTADYTMRKVDNRLVTNHTVTLSKLSAATTYRFQVVSTDERNSTVRSADMALTTLAKARNKAGRAVESEEGASGQWTTLFLPIVAIIAIVAIIVILAYPWRHEKRR